MNFFFVQQETSSITDRAFATCHEEPAQDQDVTVMENSSPMPPSAMVMIPIELIRNDSKSDFDGWETVSKNGRCELASNERTEASENEKRTHQNAQIGLESNVTPSVSWKIKQIKEVESEPKPKRYVLRSRKTLNSSTTIPSLQINHIGTEAKVNRIPCKSIIKCNHCNETFDQNRTEHECIAKSPKLIIERIDVSRLVQVCNKSKSSLINRQCNEAEMNVPEFGSVSESVMDTPVPLNEVVEDVQLQNDVESTEIECNTVQEEVTVQSAAVPTEKATSIITVTPVIIRGSSCLSLKWNIQPKFDCFKCKQRFDSKDCLNLHRKTHSIEKVHNATHPIEEDQSRQSIDDIELSSAINQLNKSIEWVNEFRNWVGKRQSQRIKMAKTKEVTSNQSQRQNFYHPIATTVDQRTSTSTSQGQQVEVETNDNTTSNRLMSLAPKCHVGKVIIRPNNLDQLPNDKESTEIGNDASQTATANVTSGECSKKTNETKPKRRQKRETGHSILIEPENVASKNRNHSENRIESKIPKMKLTRIGDTKEWSVTNKAG